MDPATCGTSTKKHNLCHVFFSWKILGALAKLTSAQAQLQSKVNMIAGKRSEDMHQTKLTWLVEAKNLLLQVEILKTEMNDAKQFLIWKQPRGLSDKFAKMTMYIRRKLEAIDKLDAELGAETIGHMIPRKDDQESSAGHTVQQKDDQESSSSSSLSLSKNCYILLKSARRAAFKIMEAFQDNDVNLIGLVGMGCVGKTTLAILMGMKARESGMFDTVIKVSGRSSKGFKPDSEVIQSDIAKALDSKWNAREVADDSSRARKLVGEILKKVEKVLIILDDVWEVIDLKAIGIPLGESHKGCKILLTTRLRHVCQGFSCQKIVHLGETNKILDSTPKRLFSRQFELGSLPFSTFHYGSGYKEEEKTAKSLELNYDYMNDKKMQSFFLLVSHFPRKYAPTIEELTRYGFGQGLFKDYESIESARNEAHSIVSSFRSSLIVEEEEDCVRMFDPFRKLPFLKEKLIVSSQNIYRAVFSNELSEHEELNLLASNKTLFLQTSQFLGYKFFDLEFSNLHTLTIIEDDDEVNFYEGRRFCSGAYMAKLKVLCLQADCFPSGDLVKNPPTLSLEGIENLKGLQTLQVKRYKLKGLSSLVELNKLEILGFLGCTFEDKLPEGLEELHNLKMLDFTYCVELHEQPQEWVLKLSKLEELYITDVSLQVWSRSGFLQRLQKLNSHLSLIVLLQEVNYAFYLEQFVVPRFSRYRIELINLESIHFKPPSSYKALRIKALPISPFLELFKDVEYLHLSNAKDCYNIVPGMDKGGLSNLQDLRLHHCEDLEYLIDEEGIGDDLMQVCTFSKLTNLVLEGLAKLKSLWKGGGHIINLGNLKNFRLRYCNNLEGYIFSKLIAQSLKQLEILEVSRCDKLEAVLEQCSDNGLVCFPNLVTVKISNVEELLYVFPSYVKEGLPKLEELQVSECWKLKHIFISSNSEVDDKNEPDLCCHLELPQLRRLVLRTLDDLKTFFEGKDFIVASFLEDLQVDDCPNLQPFTLTLKNRMLPQLKKLCLGTRLSGSEVSELDVVKAYTKRNKWSTSRPHFVIGTRPFDSLGTYFLSNLKELKLESEDLQVLWKDSTISGLQNLTHLTLCRCCSLEYVFTPVSVHNVPHLKCLRIEDCGELGQIVAEDETTNEAHGQQHRPLWFPNLTDIDIDGCPTLSNVFPARLADRLPKLKRLQVVEAESLTQIFGPDRDSKETSNSRVVQLPLLQNLILEELTNMVRFAPEGLHFTFPALDHLEVRSCTKVQTSFYAVEGQGVCAITERGEIKPNVDYAQVTNAAVAVPIFSGDNYKPWRNKMMTYFKSQGLWEVIQPGIKVALKKTPNQKKKDARALLAIQNAVLDPIYSKIIEATSARDAWLTLENLYLNGDDPHIRKLFSGNQQEAERWSTAKMLLMDGHTNILWPDGRSASEHEEEREIIVDLRDPDGLRALDLI